MVRGISGNREQATGNRQQATGIAWLRKSCDAPLARVVRIVSVLAAPAGCAAAVIPFPFVSIQFCCNKWRLYEATGNDLSVTDFVGDSSPERPLPGELSAVRLTERSSPAACQASVCRRTEQLLPFPLFPFPSTTTRQLITITMDFKHPLCFNHHEMVCIERAAELRRPLQSTRKPFGVCH